MINKLIIAIDGPSASGKGTLAKALGNFLNLPVLYTGNIYRAIAYKVFKENQDPYDTANNIKIAKQLKISDLINTELNLEIIGQYASIIATDNDLRKVTYIFQREFIENSSGAIVEGRDIGTVICPEANFKFYITADVEIRAKRRADQLNLDFLTILTDLKTRDERDIKREAAPLKPAKDAIIIDTSKLSIQDTLNIILEKIKQ